MEGRPIEDERKGDRHKNPNRIHAKSKTKKLSKWERREIVAWDGEGYDLTPGNHVYNLLCNSNNSHLLNMQGLSTESIFEFFFNHSNPNAINVIFGGSYDVNMALGDLPRPTVEELWKTGSCYWGRYKIIYNHRKKFTLHRYYQDSKRHDEFILWDVLGYFQQTFVSACRKWLGDLPILDMIEEMKHNRGSFEAKDIDAILHYCQTECGLLVQLVSSLFAAMDEGNITLNRYDGAGSIAAALLRKYKTEAHRGEPTEEVKRWAQYAYSGGWIEAMKIGNQEGVPIYRNDINSAYPSAAMSLPSYNGATWTKDSVWNGLPSSLVRVRWNFKEAPYYPLFYRESGGSILHPKTGEGIYFGAEIANLFKYHKDEFEIVEALNVHLADDSKPFDFIAEVYQLRLLYKSMGSMASEALKLGMNSVYGKLAQQAGYRNGRIPTYHHLLWAGEITARTRAKLYSASMERPYAVIAFATDAIISTEDYSLSYGSGLGEWSPEIFEGITIIQPGVYFLRGSVSDSNPTGWHDKYRGFDKGAILREGIVEAWDNNEESYTAYLTRFVTMGSALARKPQDFRRYWRTWAEQEPRSLDLRPVGKRTPGQETSYGQGLCDTIASVNYTPDTLSAPFPLEWVDGKDLVNSMRPQDMGVDMRVIEQEYEESYA